MGDTGEDGSNSPPLSKGSYAFNFDRFDDPNFDPFQSKGGLSNSPDKELSDPFKTSTKLSSSPPLPTHKPSNNNNEDAEKENPFVTKSKLGQSPPRDNSLPECDITNDSVPVESEDSVKTASEAPVKKVKTKKGLKAKVKKVPVVDEPPAPTEEVVEDDSVSRLQEDADGDAVAAAGGDETEPVQETPAAGNETEPVEPVQKPPSKKASPKKSGMKKPKARSKFKPPPNFGVQDTGEDVVIFAPTKPEVIDSEQELPVENGPMSNEDHPDLSNQMQELTVGEGAPEMIDSVHDFGAAEMPMENNEEFVQAHEAFPEEDTQAWDMMENMKLDGEVQGRESLVAFDPLAEQVPDKALNRRTSQQESSPVEDEDLMLMSTPKKTAPASRARNPAARALQEQLQTDGPREPHILDSTVHSPGRGDEKRTGEGDERYFDALDYPQSGPTRKGQQAESDVERMNLANKKQGGSNNSNGSSDPTSENFVQLVQDDDSDAGGELLKYSQSDWNKMKQELELDYNARILNKEREWSKKLADREKKISYQEEQVLLLRSANDDMKCVVAEFEKTIAQLQAEKLKSNSESQNTYEDVVKERNQALEDLQSVETAFSDLHQRYERTKGVVEGFKKNEETLKKCVQDYQQKLKQAEDKIVSVRQQAEEKLAQASIEMEKLQKSTTSEVARLEAAYKKADLKIQSLERSLDQKVQENDELTAICDELIAKVGGE